MTDNLAGSLAAFQAALPKIGKGETATIPGKDGKPGFKYSYADLADVSQAVLPLLAKHGLAWTCRPTVDGGNFVLAYSLLHTSGERLDGSYPLGTGNPQQIGSAITYARRYCLAAVVGVAPDADDDGAAATQTHYQPPREQPAIETDVDWQDQWMQQVDAADTLDTLRVLWAELAEASRTRLSPQDAKAMQGYIEARKADLEEPPF